MNYLDRYNEPSGMTVSRKERERIVTEVTYDLEGLTKDEVLTLIHCLDFVGEDIPVMFSQEQKSMLSKLREVMRGF